MYNLSLEIINACNLNCSYCYLGEKKNKVISIGDATKAIDIGIHEAQKQYDKQLVIYFIGGEPLLEFELITRIIEYTKNQCKEKGIMPRFTTTTNATLLTEDMIRLFIKEKVQLKVSIDGNKSSHDFHRKTYKSEGSYDTIHSKLHLLKMFEKETSMPVTVAMISTPDTIVSFHENFTHLQDLGFKRIETGFNIYEDWDDLVVNHLGEQIERTFQYHYKDLKKGKKVFWKQFEFFVQDYYSIVPFYYCKAGLKSVFVTVDGIIYPCTEHAGLEIGSVRDKLLTPKIRKLISMDETEDTNCLSCKYLKKCRARGCIVRNLEINNDIYTPNPLDCHITKLFFNLIETVIDQKDKKFFSQYYAEGGPYYAQQSSYI